LRSDVFVVEQQCPFLDADGCDRNAWHLLGRTDAARVDAGVEGRSQTTMAPLAAYLRSLDPGVKCPESSIGRVIVAAPYRGTGLGRALMREGITRAQAQRPQVAIRISAQLRLEAFYASLGFRSEGLPYVEDAIDHVDMQLAVTHDLPSEAI
ncbi:MAG: GNAT family N-acetyltransferase, partial [Burkholderiaceae bacterium]